MLMALASFVRASHVPGANAVFLDLFHLFDSFFFLLDVHPRKLFNRVLLVTDTKWPNLVKFCQSVSNVGCEFCQ